MDLDPRTPVIVGVAQRSQRPDDPADALEAVALMREVVELAAADAGQPELLTKLDAVAVVFGAWSYSDPGRLIAKAVGSPEATTLLSHHGGNTPQSYVNEMARRIQAGSLDVAVITGAETIWSRRRQRANGVERELTKQTDVEPDEQFSASVQMSSEFEASRGFEMPINFYPAFESAIRAKRGEDLEAHRTRISKLWEGFNAVAVENPHAWFRDPKTAEQIREVAPDNRMVGYPYTKALNSNWDLDQGAAILLCSVEAAQAAGVPREKWVFPQGGTDAHDTMLVSNRRDFHSSPAINVAGRRLFEITGRSIDEVDHLDIYSCFPSAVQIACDELGIDTDRQLTVTGGLPFAGGPLNNYVSHSIASMVEVLRDDPGTLGLVTANGGYITKHALGLYSTEPPADGFVAENVQEEVDQILPTELDDKFVGEATIEAYTVMHDRSGPEATLIAVATPQGNRTFAKSSDPAIAAEVMAAEAVNRTVIVNEDGTFSLK